MVEQDMEKRIMDALGNVEEDILGAIEKSKLSILRGMHSGDRVANTLVALVDAVREESQRGESFEHLLGTDAWLAAEAYALRITNIRNSKKRRENEVE